MARLAGFKYIEVTRKLRTFGFQFDRQAHGSHEIWRLRPAAGPRFPIIVAPFPKELCEQFFAKQASRWTIFLALIECVIQSETNNPLKCAHTCRPFLTCGVLYCPSVRLLCVSASRRFCG